MFLDALIPLLLVSILSIHCNEEPGENTNTWAPNIESTLPPCGQYGFRCLDSKTFQICPYRDSEGTTEKNTDLHECKEGYSCDEDNPAYCTPNDPLMQTTEDPRNEKETIDFYDPNNFDFNAQYPEEFISPLVEEYRVGRSSDSSDSSDSEECECVDTTTATDATTTTTTEEAWDNSSLVFTPGPSISCDNYGFYPGKVYDGIDYFTYLDKPPVEDYDNKTLFWFCDVPQSGTGFFIRHMKCGEGRYFDALKHACVLEGTVRQIRAQNKDSEDDEELEAYNSKQFSCSGKTPGKYADDKNCQLYHVCLTKIFQPFHELLFSCPDETAFDPSSQKCSRHATYRCLNEDVPMEQVIHKQNPNIQCKSPSRFREVSDCSSYYLCFGDQLLEMKCPEFYRFDDNILECLPQGIARCHEILE